MVALLLLFCFRCLWFLCLLVDRCLRLLEFVNVASSFGFSFCCLLDFVNLVVCSFRLVVFECLVIGFDALSAYLLLLVGLLQCWKCCFCSFRVFLGFAGCAGF